MDLPPPHSYLPPPHTHTGLISFDLGRALQVIDVPRAAGTVVTNGRTGSAVVGCVNMNERGDGHVSFAALDLAGARARARRWLCTRAFVRRRRVFSQFRPTAS